MGFLLNEATPYFYVKNLQGDICEIVNGQGESAARYTYDAWGNLLSSEGNELVLSLNPFTYRGYQYDQETGLYYLQSRYYNPQWGRFINADTNLDTQTSLVGTNVFAYADNNPVMNADPSGKSVAFNALIALFTIALVCIATLFLGIDIFKDANGDNYCLNNISPKFFNFKGRFGIAAVNVSFEHNNQFYYAPMQIGDYESWHDFMNYSNGSLGRLGESYGGALEKPSNGGHFIVILIAYLINIFVEVGYAKYNEELFKRINLMEKDDYLACVMEVRSGGRFGKKILSEPRYYIYKMNGV